ncbi:hypothetical protein D3C76_1131640 [compost metagenome]
MLRGSPQTLDRHAVRTGGGQFRLSSRHIQITDVAQFVLPANKLQRLLTQVNGAGKHLSLGVQLAQGEVVLGNIGLHRQQH